MSLLQDNSLFDLHGLIDDTCIQTEHCVLIGDK